MMRDRLRFLAALLLCSAAFFLMPKSATAKPSNAPTSKESASAPQESSTEEAEESGFASSEQACFQHDLRYPKKYQSEIGFFGGNYLGDEWYNTWDVGARYYFHVSNMFAFGAEYVYSPIRADSTGDFGKSLTTKETHSLFAGMMMSSPTLTVMGGVIECDLYLTVGGGSIQINRSWEPMGVIGGGLKIYTPAPWFAVRFDVNSYIHSTPKPGEDPINSDMAINIGASFLLPVKHGETKATTRLDEPSEQVSEGKE